MAELGTRNVEHHAWWLMPCVCSPAMSIWKDPGLDWPRRTLLSQQIYSLEYLPRRFSSCPCIKALGYGMVHPASGCSQHFLAFRPTVLRVCTCVLGLFASSFHLSHSQSLVDTCCEVSGSAAPVLGCALSTSA